MTKPSKSPQKKLAMKKSKVFILTDGCMWEKNKQEILRMKFRMKEEREALERANTKMGKKKLNRLKYKAVLPREELLKALAKIKITP